EGSSSREYYDDDGVSFAYQKGVYLRQRISVESSPERVSVKISQRQGSFHPPKRSIVVRVHLQASEPRAVKVGNMEVSRHASVKAFQESAMGWMYDVDSKTAWVKFA